MPDQTIDLLQRTRSFDVAVHAFCDRLPADAGAQRLGEKLRASATRAAAGYRDVSVSRSPEEFMGRISLVAREAKRACAHLQMLLQLNHVTIEATRDVLLEARALEAIFRKARVTAKRRHRARLSGRTTEKAFAQAMAIWEKRGR